MTEDVLVLNDELNTAARVVGITKREVRARGKLDLACLDGVVDRRGVANEFWGTWKR